MNSFWKEYGVIALLIVIAVGGYLLFDRNKEDILAYSLDAVGTRLVALVDDDVSKRRIALAFDSFKRRVANDEVSPEQVELVAANILNLSASGARISPEDAEFILNLNEETLLADLPMPDPRPDPAPEPDRAPEPNQPAVPSAPALPAAAPPVRPPQTVMINSRALATRIEAMVDKAETMERTGRPGIRIDETMAEKHVAWAAFLERRHRELDRFEQAFDDGSLELDRTMERLERLTSLQDKGLYAPFDTVQFGLRMDELMKRLRVDAVQGTTSVTPPTQTDSR